jgi:hypothetical protein
MGAIVPEPIAAVQEAKPAVVPGQTLLQGRPDVPSIISEVVRKSGRDERIVIAACGPESLMTSTRNITAACVRIGRPMIELHIEQFGW